MKIRTCTECGSRDLNRETVGATIHGNQEQWTEYTCNDCRHCDHETDFLKCMECGYEDPTQKDPRTPPLETCECLCDDCYKAAAEELAEDHEQAADELRATL